MQLGDAGLSRVRGYLYVFERSLRAFLPTEVALDAVREVESHILDRAREIDALPDERTALARILMELGPPMRVARAYSLELTVDEAVVSGRTVAVARALWHLAATTVGWFFTVLGFLTAYLIGAAFVLIAVLKPIFPHNVGFVVIDGIPQGFGAQFNLPPGAEVYGGYGLIPVCILIGLAILVGTHLLTRRMLDRWRERRAQRSFRP